ncbi:MAG: 2-oxoglutarate dehydrogenase complex dihydrolipoyllysine-residue succinyltransferase [Alphaproteobacteria bacterium]|nr:2-oxoglutarate dehydrogenase complex dihydrolipoyllysine-residue succinyltransferase [Alphaproteobacteria bacterium]
MTTEVFVPALGESVSEATVAGWRVEPGGAVTMDQPLVELETDKVTLEVNAPASGILASIVAETGSTVTVGALLAVIAEGAVAAAPEAATAPAPAAGSDPAPVPATRPAPPTSETVPALSPAVRRLVNEHDLDPARIVPSGRGGLLLKADVLAAVASGDARRGIAQAPEPEAEPREERVRMSRLRQAVARRLKEAQNTAAMLTTYNEADMGAVMELRSEYRDAFEARHGVRLGFMSFFVKACVAALQELPAVNAEISGDEIVYKNYYHVGVAVGSPRGLVVPVLRDADKMGFARIEQAINELSARARDGRLSLEELAGGTFTISNGGGFGSLLSSPILNPPQSGILGMHKIQQRPMAIDGRVEIRPMMYLALSYDHRIIDGREAVTFLVRVKEAIEDPRRLLIDL